MTRTRQKHLIGVLLFCLLFFAAEHFTDCSPVHFWARRDHLLDLIPAMLPPDWSYAADIFSPLWATIQMSVTGTGLGVFFALLLSPFCAGNLHTPAPLRWILRTLVQILRAFPALILALLATFLFGLGTFAGTAALSVYTLAIMTRLTYEDIEATSLSAYKALCAMGTSPTAAYFRAVVPSILPAYLTNGLYLLETNVRHSAILGYVGAGGIGLLLNEKISWLEYDKVGMILFALFLTTAIIETASGILTRLIQADRPLRRRAKYIFAAGCLGFLFCTLTIAPPDFSHTSVSMIRSMLSGFLHPDTEFFFRSGSGGLSFLLLETVCIAMVGTCAGAVLALPLSFLSTRRLVPSPIAALFRILIMAIRSIPFLIYGLIFIRVTGPGAFTGVLTLAVCSIGLLSKRFVEAIEALDFRAYQALAAMGVSPFLCVRYAVLPQLAPVFASAVLYRFDVNLREAAVLGLVGAGGIGAPLIFSMNQYNWSTAGAIFLGLVLLVWLVDRLSGKLRKRLDT